MFVKSNLPISLVLILSSVFMVVAIIAFPGLIFVHCLLGCLSELPYLAGPRL